MKEQSGALLLHGRINLGQITWVSRVYWNRTFMSGYTSWPRAQLKTILPSATWKLWSFISLPIKAQSIRCFLSTKTLRPGHSKTSTNLKSFIEGQRQLVRQSIRRYRARNKYASLQDLHIIPVLSPVYSLALSHQIWAIRKSGQEKSPATIMLAMAWVSSLLQSSRSFVNDVVLKLSRQLLTFPVRMFTASAQSMTDQTWAELVDHAEH